MSVSIHPHLNVIDIPEGINVPYGSAAMPSPLEYGVVIFLFVITLAVALLTWVPDKKLMGLI